MSEPFGEGYYLRAEGSNYRDYRWMELETLSMADSLMRHLHIKEGGYVLDFGCARGYLVKALRMRGVNAWGHDTSKWAIQNCDPDVCGMVSNSLDDGPMIYGHIIAKDVLEHIPLSQLSELIPNLCKRTGKSLLFIVPLASYTNGEYRRKEDEADITHIIRYTLNDWILLLTSLAPDFTVSGSYHIKGLKPASLQVPQSCGFLTLQKTD